MNCKISRILLILPFIIAACAEKEPLETIEGTATYYGEFFHGKKTTSGEVYDMNAMTAAHPSYPFGTKVKVTNLENEKSVTVVINDRPRTNRKSRIDLSKAAGKKLQMIEDGVIDVKIDVISWGEGKEETGEQNKEDI